MTRRWMRCAAALVALASVATACGSDDGADGTAASTPDATAAPTESDVATEPGSTAEPGSSAGTVASSDVVAPSGTLDIGTFSDNASFDPHRSQNFQSSFIFAAYDTLTVQDENFEPQPWLATGFERLSPTRWSFTLRDDVVFQDGTPFDADTVKANLERGKSIPDNPNAATFADMTEVVVVDPQTVEVDFETAHPDFAYEMSLVQGAMISPTAIADGSDLTRTSAGSGAWAYDAGGSVEGSRYHFTLNPTYWNPESQGVEDVNIFVLAENNARLGALQTGQIDVMEAVDAGSRVVLRDDGFDLVDAPQLYSLVVLDRTGELQEALTDERVREALQLAIDREALNASIFAGEAEVEYRGPYSSAMPQWLDPTTEGVGLNADVERARELLAEAGYEDGFTITMGSLPAIQPLMEAVAQMFAEIGVTVDLQAAPPGQLGPLTREGNYSVAYIALRLADPSQVYERFTSVYDPFAVTDLEELNTQAADAAAEADHDTRRAMYDDIFTDLYDLGVFIPLGHVPTSAAYADGVTGVQMAQDTQMGQLRDVRVD